MFLPYSFLPPMGKMGLQFNQGEQRVAVNLLLIKRLRASLFLLRIFITRVTIESLSAVLDLTNAD